MSEEGTVNPDGVSVYARTYSSQAVFGLPHLIMLVVLVFMSGYFVKVGWDIELLARQKRKSN